MPEDTPMTRSTPNAKNILQQKIIKLRIRAEQLETLVNELPEDLSKDAEQALWHLVTAR